MFLNHIFSSLKRKIIHKQTHKIQVSNISGNELNVTELNLDELNRNIYSRS